MIHLNNVRDPITDNSGELSMRTLLLAALFILSACAPTMNDLKMEATDSGDWTAVNARLDAEEEIRFEQTECGSRFIPMCGSRSEACKCVLKDEFAHQQREAALQRVLQRRH